MYIYIYIYKYIYIYAYMINSLSRRKIQEFNEVYTQLNKYETLYLHYITYYITHNFLHNALQTAKFIMLCLHD